MKCFTLHVMNLEYMKVSLFEMLQKNELFHDIIIFLDAPVYYLHQVQIALDFVKIAVFLSHMLLTLCI